MRRGKERWTHADDRRLGRALLAVFASQGDVVVLSDNCALWKLVQQRYQGLVAAEQAVVPDVTAAPRSARSLHTRWSRGIRPDMALFVSLVDKLQKAGKTPAKAIKQAAKLFREERSETNATAVRQYVQERQTPSSDSETDSGRPKLKFESFHFRHCYDILSSNAKFVQALLEQDKGRGRGRDSSEHGPRKRRRTSDADEYSSSTSSDGSDTEELMLHDAPAGRIQLAKVGAISSRQVPAQSSSWPHARANGVPVHPSASDSVVITFDDGMSDDGELPPRLECDRQVANAYVRLRTQTLQEDRRLKLLAELRGVVTTISQLAQQLAWNGVASAALAARTGGVCPALDEDVLRDIAFFRHEKQRLKQQIAALDGDASSA
ncbi:hypothetical protein PF005_g17784 [Phytophthora fragariae]|uniref:No apical meristem-associated C-terminal domain-containing protein n=1 Tax=Phytophthora fragariae TaxID=53985 RepID=A0A6A3EEH5_9STRA|nr:hypothetical protein PF003_g2897 [Phytophthora fragariae]KAE8932154.1 hypothetical protein PF009_g17806 [Phytophthora fragariae]KAE8996568.1 hypothetical protein PF011_g15849 [Phytophthora fragariae]KAE9096236.1 hypothetical protein PF007_g17073 [Phytophthora fragariae]KAE9096271.1 hypothetical protein PF010_g16406 [Phytophthora fragariae]